MLEKRHMSSRRGKSFQQDGLWLPDAAVTRWLFLPVPGELLGQTGIQLLLSIIILELHCCTLKAFHNEAWCLSTACLCCTTLSCHMHPAAKQLCGDQPSSLEWSWLLNKLWAAWFIWMLLQWNTGKSFFVFFGFFLRAVVVSVVVVPGLHMHHLACLYFLMPPGFSRVRLIYILKPRGEVSLCHADLSVWLSWNCVALIWWFSWSFQSLHSARRRKYFLKSSF